MAAAFPILARLFGGGGVLGGGTQPMTQPPAQPSSWWHGGNAGTPQAAPQRVSFSDWLTNNPDTVSNLAGLFLTPRGQRQPYVAAMGQSMQADKRRGAMNAWLKNKSGLNLTPDDIAMLQADPQLGEAVAANYLTPKPPIVVPANSNLYDPVQKKVVATTPQAAPEGYSWGDGAGGKTLKPIAGGPADVKNQNTNYDNETKLRSEYMTASKDYMSVRDSYTRLQAASQDNTGASDIAMVYAFMKMLDPTSVVREGEFATAANAGGIPDQIKELYNRAITGERLTPSIRSQFVQQGERQLQAATMKQAAIEKTYRGLAGTYSMDPTHITPDISGGVVVPPGTPAGGPVTINGYTIEQVH